MIMEVKNEKPCKIRDILISFDNRVVVKESKEIEKNIRTHIEHVYFSYM